MNKAILNAFIYIILTTHATISYAETTATDKLEDQYFSTLDDWVKGGGQVNELQNSVVRTCGKIILLTVSTSKKLSLSTTQKEEFHFRVDVCTKMTVNRAHPQPEFKDKEMVKMICDDSKIIAFKKLCHNSGLR